jgi:uncharacterized membrane protein
LDSLLSFIPFFQDNPTGILASVISMICFGFADSLWRVPTQVFGAARTIFFRNIFVVAIVLVYFILGPKRSSISDEALYGTIGISMLSYLGLYFFARATQVGLTSVVVPVSSANTLFTLLLHIIILDDSQINRLAGSGVAMTLVGLFLLKVNWKKGRLSLAVIGDSGFRFALLAALFWGLAFGYSWFAVTFVGPPLFSLIQEALILVFAGIHAFIIQSRQSGRNLFQSNWGLFERKPQDPNTGSPSWGFTRQWKQQSFVIVLIAVLGAIGTIFNTIALDKASINTVTGLVVMAPVISVFFGHLYYGERLSNQQKGAVFLIMAGVFVISYFRFYSG